MAEEQEARVRPVDVELRHVLGARELHRQGELLRTNPLADAEQQYLAALVHAERGPADVVLAFDAHAPLPGGPSREHLVELAIDHHAGWRLAVRANVGLSELIEGPDAHATVLVERNRAGVVLGRHVDLLVDHHAVATVTGLEASVEDRQEVGLAVFGNQAGTLFPRHGLAFGLVRSSDQRQLDAAQIDRDHDGIHVLLERVGVYRRLEHQRRIRRDLAHGLPLAIARFGAPLEGWRERLHGQRRRSGWRRLGSRGGRCGVHLFGRDRGLRRRRRERLALGRRRRSAAASDQSEER